MKKIGDYFKEIGFNPEGSDAAKVAFVKYLIKQARFQDELRGYPPPPLPPPEENINEATPEQEQLSLFDITGS